MRKTDSYEIEISKIGYKNKEIEIKRKIKI